MPMCPICNGFEEFSLKCNKCGEEMNESGRIMDYYDDYSAYMEIDHLKLEDGYPDTLSQHKCPHVYSCPTCLVEQIVFIKE